MYVFYRVYPFIFILTCFRLIFYLFIDKWFTVFNFWRFLPTKSFKCLIFDSMHLCNFGFNSSIHKKSISTMPNHFVILYKNILCVWVRADSFTAICDLFLCNSIQIFLWDSIILHFFHVFSMPQNTLFLTSVQWILSLITS